MVTKPVPFRIMFDQNSETIRQMLRERRDSVVVLVVPTDQLGSLFAEHADARPGAAEDFEDDLSVSDYKARFAENLSENRIRDLCREGAFPDVTVDGKTVPGAYKACGEWRITMEGIRARRDAERERGLKQRLADEASHGDDTDGGPAFDAEDCEPRTGPTAESSGPARTTARPEKGMWRDVIEKRKAG